ncbi:hypothetical protein FRC01_000465 [Tulasnella sp. 417]|nr:hypothetical protein FRC01_000465 [Tulasnella sp. 417]
MASLPPAADEVADDTAMDSYVKSCLLNQKSAPLVDETETATLSEPVTASSTLTTIPKRWLPTSANGDGCSLCEHHKPTLANFPPTLRVIPDGPIPRVNLGPSVESNVQSHPNRYPPRTPIV